MAPKVPPEEFLALFHPKELRMVWAREFIREYLADKHLRFIGGHTLESLTSLANSWVRQVAVKPVSLSWDDIQEAGLQVLGEQS